MCKKRGLFIFFVLLVLILPISYGALVKGTVYDSFLNKRENSIVEINTAPAQRFVVKDGTYSFNVPTGNYAIKATYSIGGVLYSKDTVSIAIDEDGEYIVDLILFPTTDEEEEILNEADMPVEDYEIESPPYYMFFYLILLVIVIYIIYRSRKEKKKGTEDIEDDTAEIIKFIKKEGGRITQKDIRKKFPQSEAKISLIISDLEDRGKIRKIKKGRGNIIILQK